jgi:para-aminobenzoate synthetase / 4-amino-4-deoxychorismate lyase
VFETILILDASPVALEAHLARLRRSVRELFDAEPPAGVRALIGERAAALPVGRVRVTVAPGADGSLGASALAAPVDRDELFPSWERAVALRPLVFPHGLGAHKWADRDGRPWSEAVQPEGSLALLLDRGGEVLEASRANVFTVEGGVLLTPPADGRILPGVARARAIETAGALGIDVREEPIELERMIAAGEAFLTGSVRGVEPVRAVGEAALGPPGQLISELAAEIKRGWIGAAAGVR